MTESQAAFVESVGQLMARGGMPRMAGRMWGWLLICQPPEQTAGQLAEDLQASRGSISGTARLLETAGLIRRSTRRGDRREYYSVPSGSVGVLLKGQLPAVIASRQLMDHGLELLAERPPQERERLQEVRDLYAFFEEELPATIERFEQRNKPSPE
jgi:DNA-binding transcriptional regulator GbsR (MarR family)